MGILANIPKGLEEALKAARYFGAEVYADERRTNMNHEDRENCAFYYGVATWSQIPEDVRMQLLEEFQIGVNAERKYHPNTKR